MGRGRNLFCDSWHNRLHRSFNRCDYWDRISRDEITKDIAEALKGGIGMESLNRGPPLRQARIREDHFSPRDTAPAPAPDPEARRKERERVLQKLRRVEEQLRQLEKELEGLKK